MSNRVGGVAAIVVGGVFIAAGIGLVRMSRR